MLRQHLSEIFINPQFACNPARHVLGVPGEHHYSDALCLKCGDGCMAFRSDDVGQGKGGQDFVALDQVDHRLPSPTPLFYAFGQLCRERDLLLL